MSGREYSEAGFALTRSFEGLRLRAYQDSAGVWTIGYGHTGPEVHASLEIPEAEAEVLLRADLQHATECVNRAVKVALSQGQFDALVDFCFNLGGSCFLRSNLLHRVNGGDFVSAARQFALWVHASGQELPGLVKRRQAEAALFAET